MTGVGQVLPGGVMPGGAYDPRHANAALVRPALAGAQGQIRSGVTLAGGEAAVVRHKNDDGFFGQAIFFQGGEDAGDPGVELLQHSGVERVILNEANRPSALLAPSVGRCGHFFLFVFSEEIPACADGGMHGEERQISVDGGLGVGVDERDGFVDDAVGSFGIVVFMRRGCLGFWIPKLGALIERLGESLGPGVKLAAAEVPFTGEERRVPAGVEGLGDGYLGEREVRGMGGGAHFL